MSLPSPTDRATDASTADGALPLAHTGLIRAAGADAAAFLHGQLTNDFTGLGLGDARLAAYCSPKGRMLAAFVGFKHAHDELWLACRREVLPAALKRLRMFVLRSKLALSEADDLELLGLAGPSVAARLPGATALALWKKLDLDGAAHLVRLPDGAGRRSTSTALPTSCACPTAPAG
ncbi:MAG TPA: hypothetical protein VJM48_11425, partial [Methylibium sp.]|nr:hypothetical protein [Methylibium sp.]